MTSLLLDTNYVSIIRFSVTVVNMLRLNNRLIHQEYLNNGNVIYGPETSSILDSLKRQSKRKSYFLN